MSVRRPVGSLFNRLLCALAILCASAGAALGLEEGPWTVAAVHGEAQVSLPTRAPRVLKPGDRIEPGSEIATAAGSRVTLTRGKTSMTLSPDSRTQIPFDSDRGQRTTIFQRFGSLLLQVDKRPEQHFEVKTPFLAAVVKGTTFSVAVGGTGASVFVSEGAVEVGALASGQVRLVRPGQTASVGQGPNADLKIHRGDRQQGERGTGEAAAAGPAGKPVAAGTQSDRTTLSAIPKAMSLAAPLQGLKITRTIGLESLDIASLTDGLVAPVAPPARVEGLVQTRVSDGGAQPRAAGSALQPAAPSSLALTGDRASVVPQRVDSIRSGLGEVAPGLSDVARGLPSNGAGLAGAAPGLTQSTPDVSRVVRRIVNPALDGAPTGGSPQGGVTAGGVGD